MFSPLTRGLGYWTGEYKLFTDNSEEQDVEAFFRGPAEQSNFHRHGITVSPRSKSACSTYSSRSRKETKNESVLPKTFLTRKGALLLFSAPDEQQIKVQNDKFQKSRKHKELIDLSLKLRTVDRLGLSALQYGDQDNFRREDSSITDPENKAFWKFLPNKSEDEGIGKDIDAHSQPGGDLNFYLKDLRSRTASARSCYNGDTYAESVTEARKLREFLWSADDRSTTGTSLWPPTVTRDNSSLYNSDITLPTSVRVKSSDSRRPKSRKLSRRSIHSRSSMGRPVSSSATREKLEISNVGIRSEMSSPQRPKSSKPSSAQTRRTFSSLASDIEDQEPYSIQAVKITRATSPKVSGNLWERVNAEDDIQEGSVASSLVNEQDLEIGALSSDEEEMQQEDWVGESIKEEIVKESDAEKAVEDEERHDDADYQKLDAMIEREREEVQDFEEQRPGSEAIEMTQPLMPQYTGIAVKNGQFDLDTSFERPEDLERQSTTEDGLSITSHSRSVNPMTVEINVRPTSRISNRSAGSRSKTPQSSRSVQHVKLQHDQRSSSRKSSVSSHRSKEGREIPPSPVPAPPSTPVPGAETEDNEEVWPADKLGDVSSVVVEVNSDELNVNTNHSEDIIESPQVSDIPVIGSGLEQKSSTQVTDVKSADVVINNADLSDLPDQANDKTSVLKKVVVESIEEKNVDNSKQSVLKKKIIEKVEKIETPEIDHDNYKKSDVKEDKNEKLESVTVTKDSKETLHSVLKQEPGEKPQAQEELSVLQPPTQQKPQTPESKVTEKSLISQKPSVQPTAQQKPQTPDRKVTVSKKPPVEKKQESKKGPQKTASVVSKGKQEKKMKQNQEQKKEYTSVLNITSVQPDERDDDDPLKALDSIKTDLEPEPYVPPPPPKVGKVEPEKKKVDLPSHMKEVLQRDEEQSKKQLESQMQLMNEVVESTLGESSLVQPGIEGMTEEDFEEAQRILKEKLASAEEKIGEIHGSPRPKMREKKPVVKKQAVQSPKVTKKKQKEIEKIRNAEKEAIKEKKRQEKLQRIQEAQVLQAQIASKEAEIRAQELEAERKQKELEEEVSYLEREADEIREAEEQAKIAMAEARRVAREEREQRRKDDLERKKQTAIQRREREKKMLEHARKMEQDMLDNIADADMRSRLEEEEQRKKYEEERLAEEKFEEEMRLNQKMSEEDEERMRELERQAEEEAIKRLEDEVLAKEMRRRELELEKQRMREEEEKLMLQKIEEQKALEEERRRKEELAEQKKEEDRIRLRQIKQMEAEARERMKIELEKKREDAIKRREANLERKSNLDKVRHAQGMTKNWEFSYHVLWPRETYEQLMGVDPEKKKGFRPKKKAKPKST